MPKQLLPNRVLEQYGSTRNFRAMKREQLDDALAALDEFSMGCAFIPTEAYLLYDKAREELAQVRRMIRADTWGR